MMQFVVQIEHCIHELQLDKPLLFRTVPEPLSRIALSNLRAGGYIILEASRRHLGPESDAPQS